MKTTKRRIAMQFSVQFVIFCLIALLVLGLLFFILISFLTKKDIEQNFSSIGLSNLVTETIFINDNEPWVPNYYEDLIVESDSWLQIINKQGQVIYSIEAPNDIPSAYTAHHLLNLQDTNRLDHYTVHTELDTFERDEPLLFILGYEDRTYSVLQSWAESSYEDSSPTLHDEISSYLAEIDGSLTITTGDNEVLASYGENGEPSNSEPLEIVEQQLHPGSSDQYKRVFYNEDANEIWVLSTENNSPISSSPSMVTYFIIAVSILLALFLALGILYTFWQVTRFGQPLVLFISWLEKLGRGDYKLHLSSKQKNRVFTKKGKIRSRYKLYEEVIHAFSGMAEKLKKSEDDQKKLEQTREEWMTGISHDLRTPLSTIEGYGHLLKSGDYQWREDELKDIGSAILEKGDHMLELLQDFSLSFQLKNHALPLTKETVYANELLKDSVLNLANDPVSADYHVSFLKHEGDPLSVSVDLKWFHRLLENLLYNSIRHNPTGTAIDASLHENDGIVELRIADDGVGMDTTTLDSLFDRYYRGTNTGEHTGGSGLGMSIAKGIAEAHGARIDVQSKLGKGTTFKVYINIATDI
ncbi:sensor histidine kinase [Alkalicoccobacillus murimartini]|uniref:histidine kinase n=1 Tax=Alkalicoccobacillus murimartini TaxID=171685 RepID=A0ABT9YD35_9BACI|nr:HAMP domain-containing sensor histidine kinase [Alkalicoccobacillus murimartini]MDQ0205441.1 signal transduction histidine kinase [Alkalicoccobacillus murimartini]